ncbi:MAG: thioredoxin domain-containing protein [Saprospiraceae bacterium]|jgi:thioredoxin-related protein|nr:thioredoxin domain-containing protein [Saprospiraceae bacterium]
MQKSLLQLLFSLLFMISSKSYAQETKSGGIEFFHGSFKEALALAEKEGKLIFMDAFTVWCGPCKRMAANTFPDPTVGSFFNANFINMKVDMEKDEGPDLSIKYEVNAYPTLLFIDKTGKLVHKGTGARPPDGLIDLGRDALKKNDRSGDYEKMYNAGKRDPETVLLYLKALNQVGKPSLKIANEYLQGQKDLSTKENLEIIIEGTTEADSKIFDQFIQYKSEIIKLKSKETFESRVNGACIRTFRKALEYRNEDLLKEAQEKMKHYPEKSNEFLYSTNLEYYGKTGDSKKYLVAAKSYASKVVKKDASKLTQLASTSINYFRTDHNISAFAEKLAKKAMQNGGLSEQYLLYGNILKMNGKHKEAIAILKKGRDRAKEKSENTMHFDQLLQSLENK